MSFSQVTISQFDFQTYAGAYLRNSILRLTNLDFNSTPSIPHGLKNQQGTSGVIPIQVGIEPKSNSVFWENAAADGTNVYLAVGAVSGQHSCDIYITG